MELLIFNTERHWAYAMQLKLEIDGEKLSRKKFHMRQKLRRAVKSVIHLEQLTKQCDNVYFLVILFRVLNYQAKLRHKYLSF